ncbi:MAG: FtsK/SpoIIIE domain-containing protein, partial [Defluviitaleaceae bacterium]|nr:FtsK/SpoIIIE domain-containing protein [Defluviitaleaceae bacterium]
ARITQPGRAYLQVGNNEIYELFQSAWSGAPFSESVVKRGFDSRVYLINTLGQGELLNEDLSEVDAEQESKLTQLDVVVNHIGELHEALNATVVERPWLPPLGAKLVTPHISRDLDVGQISAHNLDVAIGMADIPEEQAQVEYTHNFMEDGNLAFFGASGFGKSTSMMNAALQLASNNSPQLLNYFILDYGNSALAQLRGLPHTADYLTFDDAEKLEKLEKLFTEELKRRKSLFAASTSVNFRMYNEVAETKLPAMVLMIDNYDVIREMGNELEAFLVKLTRDGTGVGIYTMLSASRSNAVRYSVLNNFKNKVAQFMFDESDIIAVTGRCAYKLPEVQGRALIRMKDVHVAQCYLPVAYDNDIEYAKGVGDVVAGIAERNTAQKAAGVRVVSDVVTFEDLAPYLKPQEKQAVIGFDTESTEPVYKDVSGGIQLTIGSSSTGKTNALKLIALQFADHTLFVSDSRSGDLNSLEGRPGVTYMETEGQFDGFYEKLSAEVEARQQAQEASGLRLREFCATQPPLLVLIDDVDNFIGLCGSKATAMEALIPKAMELGICFIITTQANGLKGFCNLTKIMRNTQTGLVLGDPADDRSIFQITPPRGYKATQNMGFWYRRGDKGQVKMPLMQG